MGIKILVRVREYPNKTNFPKIPLWRPFIGLQSQICYELSYLFDKKKFELIFSKGPPPYSQKWIKICLRPYMTIPSPIDSPCRYQSKYAAFKFFSTEF